MKGFLPVAACLVLLLSVVACRDKTTGIQAVQKGEELKLGMFAEGKLSGLGLLANGTNSIESLGSWKGDSMDGLGMRVNKIFTDIGEFTNGSMNGKGVKKCVSGDVYLGSFVNDTYQGKGVMFYANGRTYSGSFKNNVPDGHGTMESPGGTIYIGDFKDGMYEGDGILLQGNGKRWEGKFVHNEPSSTARFYDHH